MTGGAGWSWFRMRQQANENSVITRRQDQTGDLLNFLAILFVEKDLHLFERTYQLINAIILRHCKQNLI